MELFDNIMLGLSTALAWNNLLWCIIGVSLGTLIGVIPGVGTLATMSLLFPITYVLEPTAALIMLAGIWYGSTYGGSTASILLNLPGTPANAVTCLDGFPMAKQGRGGVALLMTTVASFFGASVGIVMMMLFSRSSPRSRSSSVPPSTSRSWRWAWWRRPWCRPVPRSRASPWSSAA